MYYSLDFGGEVASNCRNLLNRKQSAAPSSRLGNFPWTLGSFKYMRYAVSISYEDRAAATC